MKRFAVLLYGVISYALFFATFLYLIGFVGNLLVPTSLDGPLEVPLWQAMLTNILLILLFGVQHSIMARQWFKKWWTKYVPQSIERSTFVLFTVSVLTTLFAFWQPMGGEVWVIENGFLSGALMAVFALGWVIALISTFMINHFDLFGLRQVWFYFRGKPYEPLRFRIPLFYKWVRHPLYVGFMLSFWAAPTMSFSRLFFALGLTIYILRAIRLEERDLIEHFGEKYRQYAERVPMLLPFGKKKRSPAYETLMKGE
ncbi:MAG: isoprenylcysteine carboxylmethyltransferase family protein [Lewinellaceae bacterium]|nr:isoprenylcysteine carboxylmethyltransferase family protein [Lewinellaceae bacterium]